MSKENEPTDDISSDTEYEEDEICKERSETLETIEGKSESFIERSKDGEILAEELKEEEPIEDKVNNTTRRSKRIIKERVFLELMIGGKSHKDRSAQKYMQTREEKEESWCNNIFDKLVNVCFTQMTTKRGIRTYSERAVATMLVEYKQLIGISVFTS